MSSISESRTASTLQHTAAAPGSAPGAETIFFSWRRMALETVILCAACLAFELFVAAPMGFSDTAHNVYWIPVIVIASQYGVLGGLLAAAISFAFSLISFAPAAAAGADFYSHAAQATMTPALWLATGVALGGLRTLHITRTLELQQKAKASEDHALMLTQASLQALQDVDALEARIAAESATPMAICAGLSQLNGSSTGDFLASASALVRSITGAKSVTIYAVGCSGLVAVSQDGRRSGRPLIDLGDPAASAAIKGGPHTALAGPLMPVHEQTAALAAIFEDDGALVGAVWADFGDASPSKAALRRLSAAAHAVSTLKRLAGLPNTEVKTGVSINPAPVALEGSTHDELTYHAS